MTAAGITVRHVAYDHTTNGHSRKRFPRNSWHEPIAHELDRLTKSFRLNPMALKPAAATMKDRYRQTGRLTV